MPAPAGNKRVRGVQIHRPFTFGSEAIPFDPDNKPKDCPPDHTHRWRVFVRGIPIADPTNPGRVKYTDISHWLKKVQFKLHETYAQAVRMVESPENGQFFVEETGWGEFEVGMRFYFVPESGEKPQQLFHFLKLHPYTGDIEKQKAERKQVNSICYEEVVFNEPVEAFYDILTGGGEKSSAKSKKQVDLRTAEIPLRSIDGTVWSKEEEGKELDRLGEAIKKVEQMIQDEKAQLIAAEKELAELEKTEGKVQKKR